MKSFRLLIHILVSCLVFSSIGYGQTFQRTLTNGSSTARSVAETDEGGYIFTGEGLNVTKTDQYGDIIWSNTYAGTIGRCILQLASGNYLVVGETSSDLYIMKLDVNGTVIWGKSIGGFDNDYGWAAQEALDDGYIVCGYTKSFGQGGADIYLLRIDINGNLLWSKAYGGPGHDYGRTVLATSDGGFLVGGDTFSYGVGSSDVYVLKTDANGVLEWSKTYGGSTYELGYSLTKASDGNYVLCGYTNSFGAGGNDGYLLKLGTSGSLLWSKTFGGPDNDYFWSVKRTSDNGYTVCGYTNSFGPGNNDVYLLKTDELGTLQWSKNYNGGVNDYGQEVIVTASGDYVVCGWSDSHTSSSQNEMYLMRTGQSGASGCNENDAVTISGIGGSVGTGGVESVANSVVVDLSSSSILTMGIRSICDSVLASVSTVSGKHIKINAYPNPFNMSTTFTIGGIRERIDFEMFNMIGKRVQNVQGLSGPTFEIFRKNLTDGIYLYRLTSGTELLKTGKLVID